MVNDVPVDDAPTTEMACIRVSRVLSSCSFADSLSALEPIPAGCLGTPGSGFCQVMGSSCNIESAIPSQLPGQYTVSIAVSCQVDLIIGTSSGRTAYLTTILSDRKLVTLQAQPGANVSCQVMSVDCSQVVPAGQQVVVAVTMCVEVNATVNVPLLVPSYGYCTPRQCSA